MQNRDINLLPTTAHVEYTVYDIECHGK